jgi:hypothetical protein
MHEAECRKGVGAQESRGRARIEEENHTNGRTARAAHNEGHEDTKRCAKNDPAHREASLRRRCREAIKAKLIATHHAEIGVLDIRDEDVEILRRKRRRLHS